MAGLGELGTVYAPDLRGHGFSGRASHYRFVDFVPDVIRFIEQSVRGPVLLIGHSSGGIVALNIAGNRPDL